MSSANCFNLNQSKILSSGNGLSSKQAKLESKEYQSYDKHSVKGKVNGFTKVLEICHNLNQCSYITLISSAKCMDFDLHCRFKAVFTCILNNYGVYIKYQIALSVQYDLDLWVRKSSVYPHLQGVRNQRKGCLDLLAHRLEYPYALLKVTKAFLI